MKYIWMYVWMDGLPILLILETKNVIPQLFLIKLMLSILLKLDPIASGPRLQNLDSVHPAVIPQSQILVSWCRRVEQEFRYIDGGEVCISSMNL